MLLNDFLYRRSLLKTEQYQNRLKFNTLVPKTNIFDGVENPFEKEEYVEEIKTITVKGGTEVDDAKEEVNRAKEEVEDVKGELEEAKEELEEKNKELEDENKELEEKNKELEEEKTNEEESTSESLHKIKKAVAYLATKDGGEEDNSFEHKDVIFDNLSKEGGTADDKDIKNVVVSFF
jgi:chromosome segregation ATPase|tara:strand:+ start:328 stop:861 length:534 start_codon:yes stop_codon:yes gene_type:complete